MKEEEQEEEQETSWGKLIIILIIGLIFLAVTIFGLIQNYYAVKAIASISNMINNLEGNTTNLWGLNYMNTQISNEECFKNNVRINCSEIDNLIR